MPVPLSWRATAALFFLAAFGLAAWLLGDARLLLVAAAPIAVLDRTFRRLS
jgi:hypothetical protein